jgi:hypothetical protein
MNLLLLSDGRFPAGGHAHSGGIEAAVMAGRVTDVDTLGLFLAGRLATAGRVAAALAAAAADRRTPPVDLLHPRKRPAPPSRARTYVLAGAAAALLAAALGWKAYRNLQTPLEDAATARAEQQALKPILEKLAVDETKAAAIRHWLDESTSLLAELDQLGPYLRPEPFDSDKFKAEQDLVVTKLTLTNRQMTLDAVAKASDAILPAEGRLRSGNYRVDRGPVETNSKTMPGYAVSVSDTIQHAEAPAPAGGRP